MDNASSHQEVTDLTTKGLGVSPDAEPLVYAAPQVERAVPGVMWSDTVLGARALFRFPTAAAWNGKLMIGATPGLRNEYSLDLLLGDIVLQHGYAFVTCDKATPGLTLLDPSRSMEEWRNVYQTLTQTAQEAVETFYGKKPLRTYISGVSNGGYITRVMLEQCPELFDGGVDWEGVFWDPAGRHVLTTWPVCVKDYPIYCNWRGDKSQSERNRAYERLLAAGLHPASEMTWHQYYLMYWLVSLWIYGRNLDPDWLPFHQPWSNDWLQDSSLIADYPWQERLDIVKERISPIANSGELGKPLLSVAGNWDCQLPFQHHGRAYASLVQRQGFAHLHRMYEIDRGNHVEGLLRQNLTGQQPVQPFYEAALYHLEDWVEGGVQPPQSGLYQDISQFSNRRSLFSQSVDLGGVSSL